MARKIRPTYPNLTGKKLHTCRNRIDPAPAAVKYAAAIAKKRALPADRFAIPADLGIPAFLKRAA